MGSLQPNAPVLPWLTDVFSIFTRGPCEVGAAFTSSNRSCTKRPQLVSIPTFAWNILKELGVSFRNSNMSNSLGSSSPDSQQEASLSQIQMDFRLLDFLYSIGSFLCHASHLYSQSSFSTEALQLAADWNQGVMHSNLFYAYDLTVDM